MSDAYSAAVKEADKIVTSCINGLVDQIRTGDFDDEIDEGADGEEFQMAMAQTIEDHLTYVNTHYACAWGLKDTNEDPVSDGGADSFDSALLVKATMNLTAAVQQADFSEAFTIREDMLAEKEGA